MAESIFIANIYSSVATVHTFLNHIWTAATQLTFTTSNLTSRTLELVYIRLERLSAHSSTIPTQSNSETWQSLYTVVEVDFTYVLQVNSFKLCTYSNQWALRYYVT